MHATLKIERLQELPPSYRRVATAAVSGSLTDLWKFIEFIAAKPYHRPDLVVPALLANLQPARIPDPDHLAEMAPDRNSPMRRAVIALCELVMRNHIEKLPLAAYADVWGLIWPWFHFMDTYRESLEQFDLLNEIYPILVSAISCLGFDVATLALINTTPGVRVLIVRAWSMFLQESELSSVHGFVRLCCVPLDLDAPNATQLEELCEGAGGTLTDLAMLAVKHLQCVLRPEFPAFGKTEMFLHGVLTLLHNADQGVNPFGAELVAQGIMTVYTAILCSIGGDTGAELALLAYRCFIHLLHHIAACSGHLWMIEVLDAGLLRAIALHSTIRNQNKEMIKGLQTLLRHVLPGCMVYRSVLLRMNDAFIVAKELAGTDDFLASEIFADWENICELVESRLEMLEEYEQGNYSSNVACDNLECPQILPKRDFRRCSGCQQSYYCSHDCQKVDWQHGGHKEDCQRLRDLRIRDPEYLSARDMSFMQALVKYDQHRSRGEIYSAQVYFMREYPKEPFFMIFDYTGGACNITIMREEDVPVSSSPTIFDVQLQNRLKHSSRRRGGMEIGVLLVSEGCRKFRRRVVSVGNCLAIRSRLSRIAEIEDEKEFTDIMTRIEEVVDEEYIVA